MKTQSGVLFNEERNAYTSCPPAYETKEQRQEEDIFGLKAREPRQLEYIEESLEEHTSEERNTLEGKESPEERKTLEGKESPEERNTLEDKESPEEHTPED